MKEIVTLANKSTQEKVNNVCISNNICSDIHKDLVAAASDNVFDDAFNELETDWKRKQYYKENCHFVEPQTIRYNTENPLVTDSFQYISLLDSLRVLLRNKDILSQVLAPVESKPHIVSSFSDGAIYQQHPIFQAHPKALQLVLYADEFDVVNPLGVHASMHKVLAFYFTVANISRCLQSKKDVIQVLAICYSSDVKSHGLKAVADVIFDDIQVLEQQGIEVTGSKEQLYGSVAYIAGDNLNSHMIGGFNGSFGPKVVCPCRYCLTTNTQLQEVIECDQLQNRTPENYNNQVSLINQDETQKTNFGIRYESPFNRGLFHVVDRLPPDIMHDLLEAIVPFEMALVLKQLIVKDFITVAHLNRIINTWPYGSLDRQNKPVPLNVSFGDRIKQNAGRMWCLLRLLPLMIGSLIPHGDEHWSFLLELKDIVDMVFSYKLSDCHILSLTIKIQDHLAAFKDLFPARNLLPKHHFMLHYPRLMSLLGPLRLAWCMRFESKHAYFSKLAKVMNNFKSLCSSFAIRHQLKQAYCLTCETGFQSRDTHFSRTVPVTKDSFEGDVCDKLVDSGLCLDNKLYQCRFVQIDGITYYKNMFVVVTCQNDTPVFGRIQNILLQELVPRFVLHLFHSCFCSHLGAFSLEFTSKRIVLTHDKFFDYYPLTAYNVDGTKYVSMKNFVFDEVEYSNMCMQK